MKIQLRHLAHARSGDKGDTVNVGLIAYEPEFYDALVAPDILDRVRRDAERVSVGKRKGCHSKSQSDINKLLVSLGEEGKRVVRLKSGDPLVYGRAGEEMAALREAGIGYEIVPGITSALNTVSQVGYRAA